MTLPCKSRLRRMAKPRRRAILRRYVQVLAAQLKAGFSEVYYGGVFTPKRRRRHWSIDQQRKSVKAKLAAAKAELLEMEAA